MNAAVDLREQLRDARNRPGRGTGLVMLAVCGVVGLNVAWVAGSVQPRLRDAEAALKAAVEAEQNFLGENALVRLQNENLREIIDYSARYRIPADLAQAIHSIAIAEDLDPEMAFSLVETESSFRRNALSEAGAVGYTQILPSTAAWLDPNVGAVDLYERDVNLRLGFRYLRLLLEEPITGGPEPYGRSWQTVEIRRTATPPGSWEASKRRHQPGQSCGRGTS